MSDPDRRQSVLRWILAFSILTTALHFTHNFVAIDQYPRSSVISNTAVRVAIAVSWPLLTAVGLLGYRLYARRDYPPAHVCLAIYSALPLATLGHFTVGSPDIPAFWYATIFTDALAGLAMLAFVALSTLSVGRPAEPDQRRRFSSSTAPNRSP
jgi:hypothetical protein